MKYFELIFGIVISLVSLISIVFVLLSKEQMIILTILSMFGLTIGLSCIGNFLFINEWCDKGKRK